MIATDHRATASGHQTDWGNQAYMGAREARRSQNNGEDEDDENSWPGSSYQLQAVSS